ncbi:MAG: T9SS type A sorting domain-containing protein [Bacteroidales bacterium]|nr:T9SS type A sorting domain-containing protein [Bacteroidales bacterium]
MKRLLLLSGLVMILFSPGYSDSCLPEGIEFKNQFQVMDFPNAYPECTVIEGDVLVNGAQIVDLDGLSNITAIGGSLTITNNMALTSLSGLVNLQHIGGDLIIDHNSLIANFTGLDSLVSIEGKLEIIENKNLAELTGLEKLTSIGGWLKIEDNIALTGIHSLTGLLSAGTMISIQNNDMLESLAGLENIANDDLVKIFIISNDVLADCDVKSICHSLIDPGITLTIQNNAEGCADPEQVQQACDEQQINESPGFIFREMIYPNPSEGLIFISKSLKAKIEFVTVYDRFGRVILKEIPEENSLDISVLSGGLYLVEVTTKGSKLRTKLVVR